MFAASLDDMGWIVSCVSYKQIILLMFQEFRHLTEHHTNHEDKLQIKSIVYHSVKVSTPICYFLFTGR
jgi:hypothetical protein